MHLFCSKFTPPPRQLHTLAAPSTRRQDLQRSAQSFCQPRLETFKTVARRSARPGKRFTVRVRPKTRLQARPRARLGHRRRSGLCQPLVRRPQANLVTSPPTKRSQASRTTCQRRPTSHLPLKMVLPNNRRHSPCRSLRCRLTGRCYALPPCSVSTWSSLSSTASCWALERFSRASRFSGHDGGGAERSAGVGRPTDLARMWQQSG